MLGVICVRGEWRRVHNKELHDLYSSPTIIWVTNARSLRWVEHVAHMEERRGLVVKHEGKGPLATPGWK
jgi:hypothetical protein